VQEAKQSFSGVFKKEENKYDPRLVTKLTPYNWTTEFKEAFLELALNYGEAGDIIITGQDIVTPDPGNYDDVVNGVRRYPGTAEGFRTYEALEKRYSRLKENKKKLLSKLLGAMEREVKDKLLPNLNTQMLTWHSTF
jgi:hypothetical protein